MDDDAPPPPCNATAAMPHGEAHAHVCANRRGRGHLDSHVCEVCGGWWDDEPGR